jgi:ATP-binding cassette subfamily B protein
MSEVKRSHPLARLWRFARPHRGRIVAAVACSIANKIFDLAPPFLIGGAVDIVVAQENSVLARLGIPDPRHQLLVLAGLTLVIWIFESVFEYAQALLWRNLAQTVQHELRLDTYAHVQELDLSFFESGSTGRLLAVLADDVNQLERFLDGGANALIQVATTVVIIGTAFFIMAPSVAWLAMLPTPFVLWGSFYFQRRIAPRYADVRERAGNLYDQLANNVGGIATIKSFTAEEHEAARIEDLSAEYRASNRKAITLSSAFSPLIRMVIVVGFTFAIVFGGFAVLEGRLNAGLFTVMAYLTQRLLWPLTKLGETFDLYQRAMASTRRILDLLDAPVAIQDGPDTLPVADVAGEMVFDHVEFGYHGDLPVLHGVDLSMPAGETTAIVGPTGSGKSTVVKLMLRFYDVDRGAVRLDGRDVRELKLASLRGAIGFVSQDVFLFPGSVHDNVAYGDPAATRAEVEAAARVAEAHEFILELPQGYDTVVGERGQKLSGGQRQRLSIARAVLKNPPILVLDEATSSVDNETEAAIQRSLERIGKGRTVVVIAHRLSTVRNADRIYVLSEGRLKEQGTHEALLEAGGLYASLWGVQTGARAEEGVPDPGTAG